MGNKVSAPPPPPPIHIPPIRLPPPPPPIHISLPPIHVPPISIPPIHISIPPLPPIHLPPLPKIPPIHLPPLPVIPKPVINMKGLKEGLGIVAGVISVNPIGKLLVTGTMGIADLATHGEASNFINDGHKTNSTLNMVPAGRLLQSIANDATNGKSGEALTKYVPDPVHMVVKDGVSVGSTLVTNPTNTLKITEKVVTQNAKAVVNFAPVVAIKPTLQTIVTPHVVIPKPTLNVFHPDNITAFHNIITPPPILKPEIHIPTTLAPIIKSISLPPLPTVPPVIHLPPPPVIHLPTIPPVIHLPLPVPVIHLPPPPVIQKPSLNIFIPENVTILHKIITQPIITAIHLPSTLAPIIKSIPLPIIPTIPEIHFPPPPPVFKLPPVPVIHLPPPMETLQTIMKPLIPKPSMIENIIPPIPALGKIEIPPIPTIPTVTSTPTIPTVIPTIATVIPTPTIPTIEPTIAPIQIIPTTLAKTTPTPLPTISTTTIPAVIPVPPTSDMSFTIPLIGLAVLGGLFLL